MRGGNRLRDLLSECLRGLPALIVDRALLGQGIGWGPTCFSVCQARDTERKDMSEIRAKQDPAVSHVTICGLRMRRTFAMFFAAAAAIAGVEAVRRSL